MHVTAIDVSCHHKGFSVLSISSCTSSLVIPVLWSVRTSQYPSNITENIKVGRRSLFKWKEDWRFGGEIKVSIMWWPFGDDSDLGFVFYWFFSFFGSQLCFALMEISDICNRTCDETVYVGILWDFFPPVSEWSVWLWFSGLPDKSTYMLSPSDPYLSFLLVLLTSFSERTSSLSCVAPFLRIKGNFAAQRKLELLLSGEK